MSHFVTYGSCGHVISQCRCMSKDKAITTVPEKCPACREALGREPDEPNG